MGNRYSSSLIGSIISWRLGKSLLIGLLLVIIPQLTPATVWAITDEQRQAIDSGVYYFNTESCSNTDAATTASTTLTGSDNAQKAFNYLVGKGVLNSVQVAGILGNLYAESGINPNDSQDGMKDPTPIANVGFGIAQWTTAGRQQGLVQLAQKEGVAPTDLGVQLDYLWQELNNGYKGALTQLEAAPDLRSATDIILLQYEAPAAGEAALAARLNYATQMYNLYGASAQVILTSSLSGGNSCSRGTGGSIAGCDFGTGSGNLFLTSSATVYPNLSSMCQRAKQLTDLSSPLFTQYCSGGRCAGMCDFVAGLTWGYLNSGYESALQHWNSMVAEGHGHPRDRNPPVGALLFYKDPYTFGYPKNDFGHIVVYLGNNMVLSSDMPHTGEIGAVSADKIEGAGWNEPYLGWSDPIFAGTQDQSFGKAVI